MPSKLVLRLRGGTDQRICMRMGSDISWIYRAALQGAITICALYAVRLFIAFSGISVGNS